MNLMTAKWDHCSGQEKLQKCLNDAEMSRMKGISGRKADGLICEIIRSQPIRGLDFPLLTNRNPLFQPLQIWLTS